MNYYVLSSLYMNFEKHKRQVKKMKLKEFLERFDVATIFITTTSDPDAKCTDYASPSDSKDRDVKALYVKNGLLFIQVAK